MTHGLKMAKLFSKSFYEAAGSAEPYWLKASKKPSENDITLITTVTPGSWSELQRMATEWEGPISATLHTRSMIDGSSILNQIRDAYASIPELSERVDVHLIRSPAKESLTVLLPLNAERNMARMFAHTHYVCEMPSHLVPATDVRRTLDTNRDYFETLLNSGDMLVIPTFGFAAQPEDARYTIPHIKSRLMEWVSTAQMGLVDPHWDINEGPTDLNRWQDATTLYAVENYDFHYEPIVIESKTVQPWCAERFLDRRSACLFSNYLAGGEFWVLPDDFVVQLPDNKEFVISDFDLVLENRLYAKFYWEQCVHHARQLDALGLWKNPRSEHVRKQCSRVIQNWGKGLIGKPE
ncbi:hypothetical protein BDA99DRAFT_547240 [Phascolomyces articulosus]|uniref:Uncharacterized protein n=1 Tax=Phascolomyces articulosus TaxID=60185 RepID=A0AAD5JYU2_9FUNG|nr:hypothetical protein BDA99DRAFT_547240 [Phascolomyces articulosus]